MVLDTEYFEKIGFHYKQSWTLSFILCSAISGKKYVSDANSGKSFQDKFDLI